MEESIRTPTQGQANPSNRILVVDDDQSTRQLSVAVLTASGYQVDTAEDGVAGWEALHARSYDLLITDYRMPKVSGIELVKRLRSAQAALPVVLISGDMPTEELSRSPSLQLAATLPKPFTVEELVGVVKTILSPAEVIPSRNGNHFVEGAGVGCQREPSRTRASFATGDDERLPKGN